MGVVVTLAGEGELEPERDLEMICDETPELEGRIYGLSETATHIIRVYDDTTNELMTFGFVDVNPEDYIKLILLCGRFKTRGWKGSELVVDKAIQLAREYGKKAVRLQALNRALLDKVYIPMGFKPLPGPGRFAELRPLPPEYGGGKNPGEEVMANNPRYPGSSPAQIADADMAYARQLESQKKMQEASEYGKMVNARQAALQRGPPPAPKKVPFPWAEFDEALRGELDADDFGKLVFSRMATIPSDVNREGKTPLEIAEDEGDE